MGKGAPRFGLDFVEQQVTKRKKWKKRGVKAGHGGDFDIDGPLKELNRAVKPLVEVPECAAANTAPAALSVTTDSMPDWALTILRSDTDIARAVAVKGTKLESPHKTRLAQGIKVPDSLRDGKLAEHWLQVRLFYTIETQFPKAYPHIFAVPNGGHRAAKTASYMRYEGQKKGTPDIVLPLPRGCYHGMFLEVKTDKGTVSKEQKQKLEEYSELGYYAVASKGFEACIAQISSYLSLPFFDGKSRV